MMKLKRIPLRRVDRLHNVALSRLTLVTMARTHKLLLPLQTWLTKQVLANADAEGKVGIGLVMVSAEFARRFADVMARYARLLDAAREEAASLPFGKLVVQHNARLGAIAAQITEPVTEPVTEAVLADRGQLENLLRLWMQRRARALEATATRVQGDGLVLSTRIWRLENDGLNRIRGVLASAMTERTSASALAADLESMLGANQEMPRWAYSRLQRMTPSERMTDNTGLLTDPAKREQGIAYKALRLARTEIQYANHAVSTEIAAHNPAVTGRKVALNPGHPRSDSCDEWAGGGPYDKSDAILPLHANCMCFYIDVLMAAADFRKEVRGWLDGSNTFLDDYAAWLGLPQPVVELPTDMPIADRLEYWLGVTHGAEAAVLQV